MARIAPHALGEVEVPLIIVEVLAVGAAVGVALVEVTDGAMVRDIGVGAAVTVGTAVGVAVAAAVTITVGVAVAATVAVTVADVVATAVDDVLAVAVVVAVATTAEMAVGVAVAVVAAAFFELSVGGAAWRLVVTMGASMLIHRTSWCFASSRTWEAGISAA